MHLRQWEQAGYHWLIRVKGNLRLTHQGQPHTSQTLAPTLAFEHIREVQCQGQACERWVAETPVRLTRPAKPSRKKSPKPELAVEPLDVCLIVSRLLAQDGRLLAEWFLLANVDDADAATLAL